MKPIYVLALAASNFLADAVAFTRRCHAYLEDTVAMLQVHVSVCCV